MALQPRMPETDLEQTSPLGGLTGLNDNSHELDNHIERPRSEPATLSNLPLELRELIYNDLFHDDENSHICKNFYVNAIQEYTDLGCRCAQGLSQTNHFFQEETRLQFFENAIYYFCTPQSCQQFLDIGRITNDIKHLSIKYRNTLEQSALLRPIFNDLLSSTSLQSLALHATHNKWAPDDPPIYMGRGGSRYWGTRNLGAEEYDCSLRPVKHPIGALLHIRKLDVWGSPTDELQEALIHLTLKMDDVAKREGKVSKAESRWYGLEVEFYYKREIIDPSKLIEDASEREEDDDEEDEDAAANGEDYNNDVDDVDDESS